MNIEPVKHMIAAAFKHAERGTQTRVADALGVRVQTVNKWAQGQIAPESHRWPALEEALGLDEGSIAAAAGIRLLYGDDVQGTPVDVLAKLDLMDAALQRIVATRAGRRTG